MKHAILSLVLLGSLSFSGIAAEARKPMKQNQPGFNAAEKNVFSTYRIRIFASKEVADEAEEEGFLHFERSSDSDMLIGMGTGFAISPWHIVSAAHVAVKDATFFLDVFDQEGVYVESVPMMLLKVDRSDPNKDLALFKTFKELPNHTVLRYGTARVGDWCYTVGARHGQVPFCVGWGILATKQHETFPGMWMATILAAPGNSGGPVYNAKHQLLGVLVRGFPGAGMTLFVKADTVKAFLDGAL